MMSGHHWTVNFNYSWSFDNNIYILLWKYILISRFFQNVDIYNRKENNGGHHSDSCIWTVTNLLYSPYVHAFSSPAPWTKCSILLTKMSSKSSVFITWQAGCLNRTVTKALESQRICGAVWIACLNLPHPRLSARPKFERRHSYSAVAYRGGLGGSNPPPPRNSEGHPKSCQTQPDCENC